MESLVGQNIRGYHISEKIGQGGYGAVYKACQQDVSREVAVKVILPELATQPEFAVRFATEARLVARLEHPHIIPMHDYWQDADGAFLVMRYLRGTLRSVMRQQGALSLAQTARLLDQICDALAVTHQAQVVHRDLKPENILLDERGNAYLTDFGIARIQDDSGGLTGKDTIVGTIAYVSPEQCLSEMVTPRSDIYSMGIMLYEMLTGEHPFAGSAAAPMLVKHMRETLPSLRETRPDLPPELDDVIEKATAKDPAERYADAQQLSEAFRAAIHLTPTVSGLMSIPANQDASWLEGKATPAGTDARNRFAMLQNVRKFWIEGVLENSLHGAALLELGMQERADEVDIAWDRVLRQPDMDDIKLRPNVSILKVFDRLNGKLLILGDPGSGKTTVLLELARDLLYRAEADEEHPIPVVFNLSSWAAEPKPLVNWLVDELNTRYQVPLAVAREWVAKDMLLLLLDGLDEVAAVQRDACVTAINAYRQEHGFVDMVVCSRILDYEALANRLKLNGAMMLQPLDDKQVESYLVRLGSEMNPLRSALAQDEMLRDMSYSPLMLSIMTLAYRGSSARQLLEFNTPEARRHHIFERYIDRMFARRSEPTGYSREDTLHYLSWLAKHMVSHARTSFYIEELQPDWLPDELQRRLYVAGVALTHGILFAAVCAIVVQLLFNSMVAEIFIIMGFLVFTVTNGLEARRYKIQPVEMLRWSWAGIPGRVLGKLPVGLLFATAAFITWSLTLNTRSAIVLSISTLISFTVIAGGFVSNQVPNKARPNEGIRRSARNAWIPTMWMGLCALPFLWLLLGPQPAIASTIIMCLGGGIAGEPTTRSGAVVVRHMVLRVLLYRGRSMPLNYARFLDYAAERVLLRKVGGGYIFIHRLLLEYFAELEPDEEQIESSSWFTFTGFD